MIKNTSTETVRETSSQVHEYILTVSCPICGKEVVSLFFGSDNDDVLNEDFCEHTVYLNNYHCDVYSDESKQHYLKEWIAFNMAEDGADDDELEDFLDAELSCGEDGFAYEDYLGEQEGKILAAFFSDNDPDKTFYYADSKKNIGNMFTGCTIAYSAVFTAD
ncbi:MAG: hypothetical protein ACRC9Q_06620 [Bacteroidales bacterium]